MIIIIQTEQVGEHVSFISASIFPLHSVHQDISSPGPEIRGYMQKSCSESLPKTQFMLVTLQNRSSLFSSRVNSSLKRKLSPGLTWSVSDALQTDLTEYNAKEQVTKHKPYRSPVSLLPLHGSVSRVPQTDLTALQVWRRAVPLSTSSVLVTVGTMPSRASSSIPSFSASISVPSTPSPASSPTTAAVTVTHTAVGNEQRYTLMLTLFTDVEDQRLKFNIWSYTDVATGE